MGRISSLVVFFSLLVLPTSLFADGFDMFGKQEDLKNTVIIDVGEAEKIDAISGVPGDRDKIKLAGRCFEPSGYLGSWGYSKRAALLLVDQSKSLKIALLENGIDSIKVDVLSVVQRNCVANASGDLPSDPQKAMEVLLERQKALQKEFDRMKNKK